MEKNIQNKKVHLIPGANTTNKISMENDQQTFFNPKQKGKDKTGINRSLREGDLFFRRVPSS